jgi:hypothetical protein
MWFGDRSLLQIFLRGTWDACVCRKLDSTILVMKSAEDGLRIDDARGAQRLMKRGILVQGSMNARFIIIDDILAQDATQMSCPPNTIMWSRHSRRSVPISLSACAFCHREPGLMGLARSILPSGVLSR